MSQNRGGVAAMAPGAFLPKEAGKPNILLILADDMGWSDLSCYGSEIRTPNHVYPWDEVNPQLRKEK